MIKVLKYNEYIREGTNNLFSSLFDRSKQLLNKYKKVKQLFNEIIAKLTDEDLQEIYVKCKLENVSPNNLEKALTTVEERPVKENNEKDTEFNKLAPRMGIFAGSLGALGYANEQLQKYLVEHNIAHASLISTGGEFLILCLIMYVLVKTWKK